MKNIKFTSLVILSFMVTGCMTYHGQAYSVSTNNIMSLKKVKPGTKVNTVTSTSYKPGVASLGCRAAGPISTPNGEPFDVYIKNALIDELKVTDLFDTNNGIAINVHLVMIDTSSHLGNAKWLIETEFSSPGKESFTVSSEHKTRSAWAADKACLELAHGLGPAVQKLLNAAFVHPVFMKWFN